MQARQPTANESNEPAEGANDEIDRAALLAAAGPNATLTPSDVEREFLIPQGTLASHRHRGTGPAWIKLGRKAPRYLRRDVLAWIEANRVKPEPRKSEAA